MRAKRSAHLPKALLAFALALGLADADPAGAERWAIIPDAEVEESGLADLLTVRLSGTDDVELVEREAIDRVFREMEISALLGSDSIGARLRLGQTLGAQRLLILRREESRGVPVLHAVVVDTALGVRLGSRRMAERAALREASWAGASEPVDEVARHADALVDFVRQARDRFRSGVRRIVGIAPLRSRNVSAQYAKYGPIFVELLTRSVMREQGVAVLEIEEARQILKESQIAGLEQAREDLFRFVDGEYLFDTNTTDRRGETVEIALNIRRGQDEESLACPTKSLAAAARWLTEEATVAIVGDGPGSGVAAKTPEQQFALLREEVLRLDRFGMAEEAEQCAAAAALIDLDDLVIGLVCYRAIENDETLSITEKVEAKLHCAERLARKGLINSPELANLIRDVEERLFYGNEGLKPEVYADRDALGRSFCDFHRRIAPLVRRMDPAQTQDDVRPIFRQLLPNLEKNRHVWWTARTQALPFVYYHSIFRWARFSRGGQMPGPVERNPHWTLEGFKRIVLESTDDRTNAEVPLVLTQRSDKANQFGLSSHELNLGMLLWQKPAVLSEDELRRFYDELARETDRPVLQFYGQFGQLACRVYLADPDDSPLDVPAQVEAMLAVASRLEQQFRGLPRPRPFDLGSPYHLCNDRLKGLREAIDARDRTYLPPTDRGRIHACVNEKFDSVAEVIPHPAPIRLDVSIQVKPIVKFGMRQWHRWDQVSDTLDLAWSQDCLYAIPAKDKLVRVYDKRSQPDPRIPTSAYGVPEAKRPRTPSHLRGGTIADVTFDGKNVWIAITGLGVWIADPSGNPVAQWNDDRWAIDIQGTWVYAYEGGKCLLITHAQGRTAISVLSLDATSKTISHKVVHRAVVQPEKGVHEIFDPEIAFRPLAVFRPLDRQGGPVWIARAVNDGTRLMQGQWYKRGAEVLCTPLRFDPVSEEVTADDTRLLPRRLADGFFLPFYGRLFAVGLHVENRPDLRRGLALVQWDGASPRYQTTLVARPGYVRALRYHEGAIHMLGQGWHRLDPDSLEMETIKEAPFPVFERQSVSAHYGLVTWRLLSPPYQVRPLMPAELQNDASLDDVFLRKCSYAVSDQIEDLPEERARRALATGVSEQAVDAHVAAGMRFLRQNATLGFADTSRRGSFHQLGVRWQLELDADWDGQAEDLADVEKLDGPIALVLSGANDPASVIEVLRDRSAPGVRVLVIEKMPLTDDDLEQLRCLPHLQALYLADTRLSDHGLAALERCPSLQILHIQGDDLTDQAVEHLAHLPDLAELTISGKGFTLKALERINELGLKKLKWLSPIDADMDPMAAYFIERKSTGWRIVHPKMIP